MWYNISLEDDHEQEEKDVQSRVQAGGAAAVADDRQNAIVVVSDPQNFPLIESIINQLDQQVDPQEVIKIIPLEYADAVTLPYHYVNVQRGFIASEFFAKKVVELMQKNKSGKIEDIYLPLLPVMIYNLAILRILQHTSNLHMHLLMEIHHNNLSRDWLVCRKLHHHK